MCEAEYVRLLTCVSANVCARGAEVAVRCLPESLTTSFTSQSLSLKSDSRLGGQSAQQLV